MKFPPRRDGRPDKVFSCTGSFSPQNITNDANFIEPPVDRGGNESSESLDELPYGCAVSNAVVVNNVGSTWVHPCPVLLTIRSLSIKVWFHLKQF